MGRDNGKKIAILGAGLAGLRLGSQLADKGFRVEIYEKNPYAGGLLRTFEKNGYTLDLGPHIFSGDDLDRLKPLLGDDLAALQAYFGIEYEHQQIRFPVDPFQLISALRPGDLLAMAVDAGTRALFGSDAAMVENADQWAMAKFGKRINECVFRNHIEKTSGIASNRISAHWATERQKFFDEHGARPTLSRMFKRSEMRPPTFHYPRQGAQAVAKKLAESIEAKGGALFLNSRITGLARDNGRVGHIIVEKEDGQRKDVEADFFASTLPITLLWDMLLKGGSGADRKSKLKLKYRGQWLFYFFINRPRLSDKAQIYYPEEHYFFRRISEPKNLNARMGNPNTTAICVEVGYTDGDAISRMNEDKLASRLISELCDVFHLNPGEFIEHFSVKVPYSYPIYELGYMGEVLKAATRVFNVENLFSFGRQGLFRYDYTTGRVMDSADYLAKFIQAGKLKKESLREPIAKTFFF
jgi:protoporphyrinogen oxidase